MLPRWSPTQSSSPSRDRGGDEHFDIWLVDRDGEHDRNLTNEPGVMHRDIAWSPDGTKLAYTANSGGGEKAKTFATHVIDVTSGDKRAVTDGSRTDFQPRWSPTAAPGLLVTPRETGTNAISTSWQRRVVR